MSFLKTFIFGGNLGIFWAFLGIFWRAPGGRKQNALQHHLPPFASAETEVATGGDSRICAGALHSLIMIILEKGC
jgi:hypothetical protein